MKRKGKEGEGTSSDNIEGRFTTAGSRLRTIEQTRIERCQGSIHVVENIERKIFISFREFYSKISDSGFYQI